MKNRAFNTAKSAAYDEFYTLYDDVAAEMRHYRDHFAGKAVHCNCDDPARSSFYQYFKDNFQELGLRRLTATHLAPPGATAFRTDFDGAAEQRTPLRRSGDFRSPECADILRESDIVATNPPFSLFKEFVPLVRDHGRRFIALGLLGAVNYGYLRPLIVSGEVRYGWNRGAMRFQVPAGYTGRGVRTEPDGTRTAKLGNVRWFTDLEHGRVLPPLDLTETYDPQRYPTYDNYDQAIEVPRVESIPRDYYNVMGVPVSVLDVLCPAQFEVLGFSEDAAKTATVAGMANDQFILNGKRLWSRLLIRRKTA